MSLPDWTEPVARYILEEGLVNTLKLSAIALVGSALIGITLGTLLTIRFLPTRALIRQRCLTRHRDTSSRGRCPTSTSSGCCWTVD